MLLFKEGTIFAKILNTNFTNKTRVIFKLFVNDEPKPCSFPPPPPGVNPVGGIFFKLA